MKFATNGKFTIVFFWPPVFVKFDTNYEYVFQVERVLKCVKTEDMF